MMIKVALELLFMAIVSAALVFELGQLNAKIGRFAQTSTKFNLKLIYEQFCISPIFQRILKASKNKKNLTANGLRLNYKQNGT